MHVSPVGVEVGGRFWQVLAELVSKGSESRQRRLPQQSPAVHAPPTVSTLQHTLFAAELSPPGVTHLPPQHCDALVHVASWGEQAAPEQQRVSMQQHPM